eukprot:CAMPEP_0114556408 /NCGR_PEP_ID=MMETSP0114-20121206/9276_1 /TAXON_ID=31324 /ORGANISM="Goniomonas sp, Strain m" /LENGTH=61 /DNA_ID=CAMNT_0001741617 /DNA_START=75 /DNA_END=258 /DNA_ORIENTATION=+
MCQALSCLPQQDHVADLQAPISGSPPFFYPMLLEPALQGDIHSGQVAHPPKWNGRIGDSFF